MIRKAALLLSVISSFAAAKDIVLWDIHGVILKRDGKASFKALFKGKKEKFVNAQKPNKGVPEIIKQLGKNGYEQHICSNIPDYAFKTLINKKCYPKLASIFDPINIAKSHVVSSKIKKPNPIFYAQYLKKNNLNPALDRIVFIDNERKNVKSAKKMGFEVIHFKSPTQLKKRLQNMKLL